MSGTVSHDASYRCPIFCLLDVSWLMCGSVYILQPATRVKTTACLPLHLCACACVYCCTAFVPSHTGYMNALGPGRSIMLRRWKLPYMYLHVGDTAYLMWRHLSKAVYVYAYMCDQAIQLYTYTVVEARILPSDRIASR